MVNRGWKEHSRFHGKLFSAKARTETVKKLQIYYVLQVKVNLYTSALLLTIEQCNNGKDAMDSRTEGTLQSPKIQFQQLTGVSSMN